MSQDKFKETLEKLEIAKERHRLENLEKEIYLKIKRGVKFVYFARGALIGFFIGMAVVTFLFLNVPNDGLIEI